MQSEDPYRRRNSSSSQNLMRVPGLIDFNPRVMQGHTGSQDGGKRRGLSKMVPMERGYTYLQSMLITVITQLRQSLDVHFWREPPTKKNFISKKAEGDQMRASIVTGARDPKMMSIEAGAQSIYNPQRQKPVDKEHHALDRIDPALRRVYNSRMKHFEEEYRTMDEHRIDVRELVQRLKTNEEQGLTDRAAESRHAELGANVLPLARQQPAIVEYAQHVFSPFGVLMLAAAALAFALFGVARAVYGLHLVYTATLLIFGVLAAAGVLYLQNARSSVLHDGETLSELLPKTAVVLRDAREKTVDTKFVVPGDLVILRPGCVVPADVRLSHCEALKLDVTRLTGDARTRSARVQFTRSNPLETANLAFAGATVVEGSGRGIVVRIGAKTLLGQSVALVTDSDPHTRPLRAQIQAIMLAFSVVTVVLFVAFFFVARFGRDFSWLDSASFIVGVIVAGVPQGLVVLLSLSLALVARSLHARAVLAKSLPSVETLGAVSCVCTDKTGSLTHNRMTLSQLWYDDRQRRGVNMQRLGRDHTFEYKLEDETFLELVRCAAMTSDAKFTVPRERYADAVWLEAPVTGGDATDSAIVRFIQPFLDVEEARRGAKYARTRDGEPAKMPFSDTHKFSLCVLEDGDAHIVYVKGSPETLWARSSSVMVAGRPERIESAWHAKFSAVNRSLGGAGERVIGFAKLRLDPKAYPVGSAKFDVYEPGRLSFPFDELVFIGLISFTDPPREGVAQAVLKCRQSGVKVIMITGDQPSTALSLARQVNIIPHDVKTNEEMMEEQPGTTWHQATTRARALVISGRDIDRSLEAMENLQGAAEDDADQILRQWVGKDYCIFARATPSHKIKIVQACQKAGHVVAVTGDGVNDSPAIKQGDIGISMGMSSSDVAKDAADVILMQDDFDAIVAGIEEGRKIFDNLKKTLAYLMTTSCVEIVAILAHIIFAIPLPLNFTLMLVVCLATDILPALSLADEAGEIDIMLRRPRRKGERLVTGSLIVSGYLQMGVIANAGAFYAFFTTLHWYGFDIMGLFQHEVGNARAAVRCDLDSDSCECRSSRIPWGSYNPNAYDLGNPYLNTDYTGTIQNEAQWRYFQSSCCGGDGSEHEPRQYRGSDACPRYTPLRWMSGEDHTYDLRQVIVEFDATPTDEFPNGKWKTMPGVFVQCEEFEGSEQLGWRDMATFGYNLAFTPYIDWYGDEYRPIPICYTTEALVYAQTSFFVALIMIQVSNVIACKCAKQSFIYSEFNQLMIIGIITEILIALLICYLPGVREFFFARPLRFWHWCAGMPFSMLILGWQELRKYILRTSTDVYQPKKVGYLLDW